MELNKLYYFYVVAKHQHVTRAAEELRIAQPALSKAMKLLELDLNTQLFYRKKRGIGLTPYGQHLKSRLDSVFYVLDQIPGELEQLKRQTKQTLRLNVQIASLVITEAIMHYKVNNEQISFQVFQNRETPDCDLSVTASAVHPGHLPDYEQKTIITEDIYLAVPKKSKYAQLDTIDLIDIREEWLITISDARPFRNICDKLCLDAGFKPNIMFESDSPAAVRNLISAGIGIGFWPAFSFGAISDDMVLLPIRQLCRRELVVGLHNNGCVVREAIDFYHYLVSYLHQQKETLCRN